MGAVYLDGGLDAVAAVVGAAVRARPGRRRIARAARLQVAAAGAGAGALAGGARLSGRRRERPRPRQAVRGGAVVRRARVGPAPAGARRRRRSRARQRWRWRRSSARRALAASPIRRKDNREPVVVGGPGDPARPGPPRRAGDLPAAARRRPPGAPGRRRRPRHAASAARRPTSIWRPTRARRRCVELFGHTFAIPTGLKHGTVTVLSETRRPVEVTTFRGEGEYLDGRRPSRSPTSTSLVEDLSRRDFTMNAVAFDPLDGRLTDPFDGQGDLGRRLIRAVGDPLVRFREDGLRPMRARAAGGAARVRDRSADARRDPADARRVSQGLRRADSRRAAQDAGGAGNPRAASS